MSAARCMITGPWVGIVTCGKKIKSGFGILLFFPILGGIVFYYWFSLFNIGVVPVSAIFVLFEFIVLHLVFNIKTF